MRLPQSDRRHCRGTPWIQAIAAMTNTALLLVLETSVNAVLKMDELATESLARFHGKVICFDLTGLALKLYFIPDQKGLLQVFADHEEEPDCTLTGSPVDLLMARDKTTSTKQLFDERIKITGNTDLAHRFSQTLASLDIDWEEQLSRVTGDVIAHELGNKARAARRYQEKQSGLWQQNLVEYLVEEKQLTPNRYEAEEFSDQIDQTRDDVERLEARINRLLSRREKS